MSFSRFHVSRKGTFDEITDTIKKKKRKKYLLTCILRFIIIMRQLRQSIAAVRAVISQSQPYFYLNTHLSQLGPSWVQMFSHYVLRVCHRAHTPYFPLFFCGLLPAGPVSNVCVQSVGTTLGQSIHGYVETHIIATHQDQVRSSDEVVKRKSCVSLRKEYKYRDRDYHWDIRQMMDR